MSLLIYTAHVGGVLQADGNTFASWVYPGLRRKIFKKIWSRELMDAAR